MLRTLCIMAGLLALLLVLLELRRDPARPRAVGVEKRNRGTSPREPSLVLEIPDMDEAHAPGNGDAPDAASRAPVGPPASPIRGRLLDAWTGAPIAQARLLLRAVEADVEERVELRADGGFETRRAFPRGEVRVNVVELFERETIATHWQLFEPSQDPWILRVSVGPLVYLELVPPPGIECRAEWASLFEVMGAGTRPWRRKEVYGEEHPYLLYASPAYEPDPDLQPWVAVIARSVDGQLELTGRAPLPASSGILTARVALVEQTQVIGRVVDFAGNRIGQALVWLRPLSRTPGQRESWQPTARTLGDGSFEVERLEPGPYHLSARSERAFLEPRIVRIGPGLNDLGDLRLPIAPSSTISGELVDPAGESYALLFLLEETGSRRQWLVYAEAPEPSADGRTPFVIDGVPPGSYELRPLESSQGSRFDPPSVIVSSPASGLLFRALPAEGRSLQVWDSETRERIADFSLLRRAGGLWRAEPGTSRLSLGDLWLVSAEGYRSALVDPTDLEAKETPEPLDVLLEPGWSLPVIVRDGEYDRDGGLGTFRGPPLPGVHVLADGSQVATSDADGLALISLASEPAAMDFVLPGWRVVCSDDAEAFHSVLMVRE